MASSSGSSSSPSSGRGFDIRLLSSSGDKRVVRLSPDTTLEELTAQTRACFAGVLSQEDDISFVAGFPPVPLVGPPTWRVSTLVRPQDTLRVIVVCGSKSTPANHHPTPTSPSKRPKRAAAEAATRAFPAVIQAQDQLLRSNHDATKKPTKKRGRKVTHTKQPVPKWGTGQTLGALSSSSTSHGTIDKTTRPTPKRPPAAAPATRRRHAPRPKNTMSSEDDVSTTLLGALNGSGGGMVGGVLRRAMRNAVVQSYEQSRASVRVSAVQSGRYSIQINESNNDTTTKKNESITQEATITYDKGMEGRGTFEEEVQLISSKALTEVIQMVYPIEEERELLRPITLAQLSPRVFWSLIHHHTTATTRNNNTTSSSTIIGNNSKATTISDALQQMLPDLDWTFLHSRTKTLSAKALENLRQTNKDDNEEHELGERAVEAVTEAMERYNSPTTTSLATTRTTPEQLRARAAQAALARLSHTTTTTTRTTVQEEDASKEPSISWKLVTPTELDKDELRHCITEAAARRHHVNTTATSATHYLENPQLVEPWVEALVTKCHIHNWRELANYKNSEEEENMSLADMVGSSMSSKSLMVQDCGVEEIVEGWLEVAREESVEELMWDICQGNEHAIRLLQERARTGTPHDLSLWAQAPDLLLSQLGMDQDLNGMGTASSTPMHNTISVDMVRTWCQRAQTLLQHHPEFEWLHWYATPIS